MVQYKAITLIVILTIITLVSGCKKNNETNDDGFNRSALLINVADNIILPRYARLQFAALSFDSTITEFTTNPGTTLLASCQAKLLNLQLAWQACSTFEFGPAETVSLRTKLNTYPTDTAGIQQNISSGNYNLADAANTDRTGLPALDYLLNGTASDNLGVVQYFEDTLHQQYLLDVSTQVKDLVTEVVNDWNTSYDASFKTNTGTDVGSSLGMLVNQINLDFEKYIRDGKIGIPLGVRSLGTPQPEKTEAYYSGNSLVLAKESIAQLNDLYLGVQTVTRVNDMGLDDYLRYLNAKHGSELLADKITDQFTSIETALDQLNGPLSDEVTNNNGAVETAYNECQKQVVLLKVDLSSALGILITYGDTDGD